MLLFRKRAASCLYNIKMGACCCCCPCFLEPERVDKNREWVWTLEADGAWSKRRKQAAPVKPTASSVIKTAPRAATTAAATGARSGVSEAYGLVGHQNRAQCGDYRSGDEGMFFCPPECTNRNSNATVWGNGPYTGDSCICKAAKHAGVIGENGGSFNVSKDAGLSSYESDEANGVTTSTYHAYDPSVIISKLF
jgi:hypothetical protein